MKATVDRIDEGVAVLITLEERPARITVPVSILPRGCREGDSVTLTLEQDADDSDDRRRRVASLVDRLLKK